MTWKQQVAQSLAALAPPVSGQAVLRVTDHRRELEAELSAIDRLACAFDTFRVTVAALANAETAQLKERAGILAAKLSYLLEPIGLIEVDADRCVVQLRSIPPQRDTDRIAYYELLAERGGVFSLRRFEVFTGQERQPVPAEVTREVFLRLADDFGSLAD